VDLLRVDEEEERFTLDAVKLNYSPSVKDRRTGGAISASFPRAHSG